METDASRKCTKVAAMLADWANGSFECAAPCRQCAVTEIPAPGRPTRPLLVDPRRLAPRGLGTLEGRIALAHAVAHIEFNAINLACDAVYRFREMPPDFLGDFIAVAADEARHFSMLEKRLRDMGSHYGALDAHDGLWQMAVRTGHDPLVRMALVPRVLEARGLDVTPGMIERLRAVGDATSADCLAVILAEEVEHVAKGTRWFHYLCAARSLEPDATFLELAAQYAPRALRGPFNAPDRIAAGFSAAELAGLAQMP